ncbi:MAG: hypothetical protein ACK52I_03615 [Pseudomonadota bacterium]|jgi:hypothetical protein
MSFITQYLYNLGLGIDQMINVLLLGDPDESLSGRMGRAMLSGKPKWWVPACVKVNDWLWFILAGEIDHSANAVEPDENPMDKELWSWVQS